MAKKPTPVSKSIIAPQTKMVATTTPVRNTAVPKAVTAAPVVSTASPRKQVTHEMIAKRAFEIYSSGLGGSEMENWQRAERELSR